MLYILPVLNTSDPYVINNNNKFPHSRQSSSPN
jgi:hypothetical protein